MMTEFVCEAGSPRIGGVPTPLTPCEAIRLSFYEAEGREPKPASLHPSVIRRERSGAGHAIILRTSSVMRGRIWFRSPTMP
jgi:hypothetical protein